MQSFIQYAARRCCLAPCAAALLIAIVLPASGAESSKGTLKLKVADASGKQLAVRVQLTDAAGSVVRPPSVEAEIQKLAQPYARSVAARRRAFYIDGQLEIPLPAGALSLTLDRGFHFNPVRDNLFVEPGKTVERSYVLTQFSDPAAEGWYALDQHVHDNHGPNWMLAEELSIATSGNCGYLIRGRLEPPRPPQPNPDALHLWVHAPGAETMPAVFQLWNQRTAVDISGPEFGRDREDAIFKKNYDHIEFIHKVMRQIEASRNAGAAIETYMHSPERLEHGAYPILVGSGWVDAYGVFENEFNGVTYQPHDHLFWTYFNMNFSGWYRFLNCGFRLTATAGTEGPGASEQGVVAGRNRAFVKVGPVFDVEHWVAAIRAGKTFVSNRPLLFVIADGQDPGAELKRESASKQPVKLAIRIASVTPIHWIEIVRNGKVVKHIDLASSATKIERTEEVAVDKSCWLAVRCYGHGSDRNIEPLQAIAHTSPFYVIVDGKPIAVPEDGKYFRELVERKLKEEVPSIENADIRKYMEEQLAKVIARYAEVERQQ